MQDYDIFHQEIRTAYPSYGYALWEPDPGELLERSPDCDTALVREDDLACLNCNLDNVLGHLQKTSPEIHRVECGSGVATARVATLSQIAFQGVPIDDERPTTVEAQLETSPPHMPLFSSPDEDNTSDSGKFVHRKPSGSRPSPQMHVDGPTVLLTGRRFFRSAASQVIH